MTTGQLRDNLKRISEKRLQDETRRIILDDKKIINRKQDELIAGSTPDGGNIGAYQSDSYSIFKESINPFAGGNVDLMLKGDYARAIKTLSLGNSKFTLRSLNWKRDHLIEKYGIENEAINQEVWEVLQKFTYLPQLIKEIKPKIIK